MRCYGWDIAGFDTGDEQEQPTPTINKAVA
jgi:hypothetical protein